MAQEPTWFEAYDDVLTPVLGPYGLVNVLLGAESCGFLAALEEATGIEGLAAATGLPERRTRALVETLVAYEVVEPHQGGYRLTPSWLALRASDAYATLSDTLASAEIEGRLLRDAAAGADYWTMPAADRLVFARAISPNPFAPSLVEAFRTQLSQDPDVAPLVAGGRLLELGCGVAGRVLTMLQALPRMTAVGVELSEDLAAEARRRAEALGVSDRFEVVCGDAATFSRPESFDVAFWSQFFFAEDARAGALRTLLVSLRAGGIAQAPLLGDDPQPDDEHGAEARHRATFRMILDGWGVPDHDRDGLSGEFSSAGFVDVRYVGGGGAGPLRLVARKP
jgi:SAM-dependent methyltransferase